MHVKGEKQQCVNSLNIRMCKLHKSVVRYGRMGLTLTHYISIFLCLDKHAYHLDIFCLTLFFFLFYHDEIVLLTNSK